ncbi:sphingosine-1-phosphate lyase, partial [mine drainage metagenome]
LNGLQLPPGLHFCVTRPNTYPSVMEEFLSTLRDAVNYAKGPDLRQAESSALYGLAGSVEGNKVVEELLVGALDAFYGIAQ